MAIKLTQLAIKDLDEIRKYSIEQWGQEQWLKYYRGLADCFEKITNNPDIGRQRDLFYLGMRSLNYKEHIIFYKRIKANEDLPVILRISHQKRNLPALIYYEELDS